jgi:hypothetical protein
MMLRRTTRLFLLAAAVSLMFAAACKSKEPAAPPVATASLQLSRSKSPLGSPIDITYKFVVANDANFTEDHNVMVHVVDSDNELLFTFDHTPPTPTSQWKPGQTIEYTKTEFIPVYPYVGEAAIELGLYSKQNQRRLVLAGGEDAGQRAYKVATLTLQPQTENVYVVFKDGWHPAEVAEKNAAVEWQWTKRVGTLAFKNPKKDCVFYLDVDHPAGVFPEGQQVEVTVAGQRVDQFTLNAGDHTLKKIPLKADQFGAADTVEVQIAVDKTYVPATLNAGTNKDPRELGVRVFHAFVQPAS